MVSFESALWDGTERGASGSQSGVVVPGVLVQSFGTSTETSEGHRVDTDVPW